MSVTLNQSDNIRIALAGRLRDLGMTTVEMVEYTGRPEFLRLLTVIDAIPEDFTPPYVMNIRDDDGVVSPTGLYWDVPGFYMDIEVSPTMVSVFTRDRHTSKETYFEDSFLTTAWFDDVVPQLKVSNE